MAYDVTIEENRSAGKSGSAKVTLIAALTSAVVVFSLVDTTAPATPDEADRAAPVQEDWHGNVRRSNWPY